MPIRKSQPYTIEEIFDFIAKKEMIEYNPQKFKEEYRTLFKVITKTVETHTKQFIDLAVDAAERSPIRVHYTVSANIHEIDTDSIKKLKEQIK